MDNILDAYPAEEYPVLPAEAQEAFEEAGWLYLKCQNLWASKYKCPPLNLMLFDVTIKSHYIRHIILMSWEEKPSLSWCYGDELLMADLKKNWKSYVPRQTNQKVAAR